MIATISVPSRKVFFRFTKLRGEVGEFHLVTGLKRDPAWPDKSRVTTRLCLDVWQARFHTSARSRDRTQKCTMLPQTSGFSRENSTIFRGKGGKKRKN